MNLKDVIFSELGQSEETQILFDSTCMRYPGELHSERQEVEWRLPEAEGMRVRGGV